MQNDQAVVKDLYERLQSIELSVKTLHYSTKSHSFHVATDNFLKKFSKLSDKCIEVFLGRKQIHLPSDGLSISIVNNFTENNYVSVIDRFIVSIEEMSEIYEIDDDIVNIFHEITATLSRFCYFLNLK